MYNHNTQARKIVPIYKTRKIVKEKILVENCDVSDDILKQSYDNVKHLFENRRLIPQNLAYLMQNTEKEIERNYLLAKIRMRQKNNRMFARFKIKINEFFYSVEEWPNFVLKILLSTEFGYSDCIGLACFFHGNGLRSGSKALKIFQYY